MEPKKRTMEQQKKKIPSKKKNDFFICGSDQIYIIFPKLCGNVHR